MIGTTSTHFNPGATIGSAPDVGANRTSRVSTLLAWASLAAVLILGAPIFLCMPVWFDIYHYDICGRTMLQGGVLYRDVFDNNLPGIIWMQTGVRLLVGPRSDAIRLVDLAFYTVDVLLLLRWAPRGVRVWAAVAFYAFYLFVPESCPCERDLWMLLPGVVGLTLRQAQVRRLTLGSPCGRAVFGLAALEGVTWAAGVWIKPFVFVPAFACWFTAVLQVNRLRTGRGRLLTADALGLLAGGLLAGGLGLLWLWRSGSWPYFWEILLGWNRDYSEDTDRVRLVNMGYFLLLYVPWSAAPIVAVGLAATTLKREIVDAPKVAPPAEPGHALLAAVFLGWLFQAAFLQLTHDYSACPALILGLALVAARWRLRPPTSAVGVTAWLSLAVPAVCLWSLVFHLNRIAYWPECVRGGSTPHTQSVLAVHKENAYCVDAEPLAAVADYLRGQGVGDGELTCMSGCTHPLYLDLNVKPSTRFPQMEMTGLFFIHHRDGLIAELAASRQRYIVSDLAWTGMTLPEASVVDPDDPLALPPAFPEEFVGAYPWREPIVFRSGRYLVHRAIGPVSVFWKDDTEKRTDGKYKTRAEEFFAGRLSVRDGVAARDSVALLDEYYRQTDEAHDLAGRRQALRAALTLLDEARCRGKDPEAELVRRWLQGAMNDGGRLPNPAGGVTIGNSTGGRNGGDGVEGDGHAEREQHH